MYYDLFILGSLLERPRYGYEIKKELVENFNTCSAISNNSLYPILKKFQTFGATEKTMEIAAGKPNRIVYSITPQGRRLFADMLRNVPESQLHSRDEFFMRLYFFEYLPPEVREHILAVRDRFLAGAIEKYEARSDGATPTDILQFHLDLLRSERALVQRYRARVQEPCLMDADGRFIST